MMDDAALADMVRLQKTRIDEAIAMCDDRFALRRRLLEMLSWQERIMRLMGVKEDEETCGR